MTKPFEIEELLARIRTALRFSQKVNPKQVALTFGHLSINEQTREVVYFDKDIQLTPREYDLLFYLLKHPKQVLTREQILEAVWGYDYYGDTNVVDVYIRYVRQKLEVANPAPLIQTIRGVGYVLKEHSYET